MTTNRIAQPALGMLFGVVVLHSEIARATDSDPDEDGVPTAVEEELGLDPDLPNIPEPLHFDMVRGLGARRGELELNTVVESRGTDIHGGLEAEYAFARGYALEVELPISASGIDAWKGSVQGTLPSPQPFIHGWLFTGEYLLVGADLRATALYVAAFRFDARWSALAMVGRVSSARPKRAGILNPSFYFDVSARVTLGVELNTLVEEDGTTDLAVLPQLHWQPNRWWKLQLGAGGQVDEKGTSVISALRVSFNY